ncbi:MAG: hypothetical protein DRR16_24145 [Candidatus Parabeggiatoa sp. nov. 3]|nr:MAG: hypothetical protein DRR00_06440 [Gammaproteobacteria bacterium]RKZ64631.1 MAG: hypothetical protein DRQ99_15210 [Gammaproteobacteria bacterium]RKZ80283.1 MAG: hypothetical protein DRR16_24145 [Gammaproteobacteria bacterium]
MKKFIRLLVSVFIGTIITINTVHSQTTDTYGPIKSGEMLWIIAGKVRPNTAITRYQAMLALLKANPHAFDVSCNINSLKVGQTLQIPSGPDMQAMSHSDAVKAFNRQSEDWKAYRRRRQQIVCPPLPEQEQPQKVPVIEEPQKPLPVITPNTPDTSTTTLPIMDSSEVAPVSSEVAPRQETIVSEPATTFSSLLKPVLSWLAIPLLSLIIISLLILTIIILLVLLIARRHQFKKTAATQNHLLHEHLDNKSLPKPHDEIKHQNRMSSPLTPPLNRQDFDPIVNPNAHDMKEKLDRVRSYLAENEAQTAQNTLRDVIQKGTPEQQEEARQLYEINKKINFLKQNVAKDKPMTLSSQSDNPAWQEIVHQDKHWPTQQYLPENREQVFDLIDKIFELLDYELNAQGQLVDAYVNRHRQESLKGPNYEIVEKPEKVVIDEQEEVPLRKPQSESKPTRYL